jgi:ATP-dependent DNA ligase
MTETTPSPRLTADAEGVKRRFAFGHAGAICGAAMLRLRTRRSVGFIQPCLPSPIERPPSGDGWIHEIKHDGFRHHGSA